MKVIFFQAPIEFVLNVEGESWQQGDQVSGTFSLINRGGGEVSVGSLSAYLAWGEVKKIRAKDESAFKILAETLFGKDITLAQNAECEFPFNFQLVNDCPLSEKMGSVYILGGDQKTLLSGAQLELQIRPHQVISNFIEVFENLYRFKVKVLKNKKGYIEATLKVPDTKEFVSIQQFKLDMKMSDSDLELKYLFKVKKMSLTDSVIATKDSNLEIKQVLTKKQYSIYGDGVNQEEISRRIGEVLEQVKTKPLLG